jgi:hypothetical protein
LANFDGTGDIEFDVGAHDFWGRGYGGYREKSAEIRAGMTAGKGLK